MTGRAPARCCPQTDRAGKLSVGSRGLSGRPRPARSPAWTARRTAVEIGNAEKRLRIVREQVALALGVSASTVTGNLEAISVLRNHIAHHARLWMRPTSPSPRIPKRFPAWLRRSVHPKSMYGVFLALAEMLGPDTEGKHLLTKIDAILTSNDQFQHGITQPITP